MSPSGELLVTLFLPKAHLETGQYKKSLCLEAAQENSSVPLDLLAGTQRKTKIFATMSCSTEYYFIERIFPTLMKSMSWNRWRRRCFCFGTLWKASRFDSTRLDSTRHFVKVDAWDVQAAYKQLYFTEMDGVSRIREGKHIFKNSGGGDVNIFS